MFCTTTYNIRKDTAFYKCGAFLFMGQPYGRKFSIGTLPKQPVETCDNLPKNQWLHTIDFLALSRLCKVITQRYDSYKLRERNPYK